MPKQLTLKPHDLALVVKLAVNIGKTYTFSALAAELKLSASEAHGAVQRARASGLLTREMGSMAVDVLSLHEFVFHGVKYAFPGVFGPVATGLPTASGGPALARYFSADSELVVWPSHHGNSRGATLQPLYEGLPVAAAADAAFYEAMSLVDAFRVGSARDREIARSEFARRVR